MLSQFELIFGVIFEWRWDHNDFILIGQVEDRFVTFLTRLSQELALTFFELLIVLTLFQGQALIFNFRIVVSVPYINFKPTLARR